MKTKPELSITVTVNGRAWELVASLRNAQPSDKVYVIDGKTGYLQFGDGLHGSKPPAGSRIRIQYRHGGGGSGNVSRTIERPSDANRFWVLIRPGHHSTGWGQKALVKG
jgi:hypothetical protein